MAYTLVIQKYIRFPDGVVWYAHHLYAAIFLRIPSKHVIDPSLDWNIKQICQQFYFILIFSLFSYFSGSKSDVLLFANVHRTKLRDFWCSVSVRTVSTFNWYFTVLLLNVDSYCDWITNKIIINNKLPPTHITYAFHPNHPHINALYIIINQAIAPSIQMHCRCHLAVAAGHGIPPCKWPGYDIVSIACRADIWRLSIIITSRSKFGCAITEVNKIVIKWNRDARQQCKLSLTRHYYVERRIQADWFKDRIFLA